jgi:hypothetical protein
MISDETSEAVRRIQNFAAVSVLCCAMALVIRIFLSSLSPIDGLRGRWIRPVFGPAKSRRVASAFVLRTHLSYARRLRPPRRQA